MKINLIEKNLEKSGTEIEIIFVKRRKHDFKLKKFIN